MNIIAPGGTIGIIGGGQLGRMIALAASSMGYRTHIFCPHAESPAIQVSSHSTIAEYDDKEALEEFARNVDVVSFEFENVPDKTVLFLDELVPVRPRWNVLHIAQNRIREKGFCDEIGAPVTRYAHINNFEDLAEGFASLGQDKSILKTVELGYDGKGQFIVEHKDQLEQAWEAIGKREAILEAFIPFTKEISVIIARGVNTETVTFPVSENIHKNGVLDTTIVPASINRETEKQAIDTAISIADNLHVVGLVAVEFFVKQNGDVLVNEMAPRPHNSGHRTMDGCVTSQFEQLVRAICGLPLGDVTQHSKVTMKNLLGRDIEQWQEYIKDPTAKLHLYGKKEARQGRKMGHINFVCPLEA